MDDAPRFLKIIFEDEILGGKVGLPKRFVKKHENGLSSPVTVKVPSGETWEIEFARGDGEIWLEKGWKEFADFHSLECGSFLVFEYQGDCNFCVIICDLSCSEIEYPTRSSPSLDQNDDGEIQELEPDENDDAISVEDLDDPLQTEDLEETSLLPFHRSCKFISTGSTDTESNSLFRSFPGKVKNSHHSKRKTGGNHKETTGNKNASGQKAAIHNLKALEDAKRFITNTKHPSFTSVVWLTTVKGADVSIPCNFSQKYFGDESMMLKFQVADRLWPVKFIRYSNWKVSKFSAGWRVFSRDNSLKAGDVCAFEMIKRNLLNVHIFRRS